MFSSCTVSICALFLGISFCFLGGGLDFGFGLQFPSLMYKMPRTRDIGWQHGKMIGGCRHHLQCNYCHRVMIGGITRFKKHLAHKRGEVKGCDAVPEEVRVLIKKHLAAKKVRKATGTRKQKVDTEASSAESSEDKDVFLDEPEREAAAPRPDRLWALNETETIQQPLTNENQPLMVEAQEFFDAFSANQNISEQVLAPPRTTDPGWDHGTMITGGRHKIKCKYCHKVILGGGISRLKQHLAGERGNVAPCEMVPEDVKLQIQQHLRLKVLEKLKRQKVLRSSLNSLVSSPEISEEEDDCGQRKSETAFKRDARYKRKEKAVDERISGGGKKHKKQNLQMDIPVVQQSFQQNLASQESIDKADMAIAKFIYDAGIPLSALNSYYFQQMADAIAAAGPGYKMPSYHSLRGNLLHRSIQEVKELFHEIRRSWEVTGCSVMVDRWSGKMGSSVMHFFVYCPKGTVFLKSVDSTDATKSPEALLNIFDSVVQEVGPQNIVNFMTDTAPSYKAAGQALMGKYRTFFWSACSAHCIHLMFERFGEMDGVKEILGKAKRITRFIYNNAWVLNLMKKGTSGRDIVQLAKTRCVTNFMTLQSIVLFKNTLRQMFTSPTWLQSALSKQKVALDVVGTITDPLFWSICDHILKAARPLLSVWHLADCKERPSVGFVHDAIEKAKQDIILAFNNKDSDYGPYLNIIDHIWQEELHSPLHAAGYYLNPSLFYNSNFANNKMVQKGLLDCIETLEPSITSQVMITNHINFYKDALGDFGRPMALRGRESLDPATWWSLYAADYPGLQRLAIRVLSQTCSIIRCEGAWSMFAHIHTKKRNQLEHQRLNDLMFVRCNLGLQERRDASKGKSTRGAYDPVCLEAMDAGAGDWVEDPESIESDYFSLMDLAIACQITSLSPKIQSIDRCMNSAHDGCSHEPDNNKNQNNL